MLTRVRELVLPSMTDIEPIQAWIIDDTGFPKKGTCSVGVARQYCGQTGKQDNCQVAVSLSVATHQASLPIAYRLYLPKDWADDAARRAKVGVPDTIKFQTKPDIALEQIRALRAAGVPGTGGVVRPGLRQRRQVPRRDHRRGPTVRGRCVRQPVGLAARRGG